MCVCCGAAEKGGRARGIGEGKVSIEEVEIVETVDLDRLLSSSLLPPSLPASSTPPHGIKKNNNAPDLTDCMPLAYSCLGSQSAESV